jgi:hypothetical protein
VNLPHQLALLDPAPPAVVKRRAATRVDELARGNRDAYFRSTKAPGPLDVAVGELVAYARYFLLQTGADAVDDRWHWRGTVVELRAPWVLVRSSDGTETLVHPANLARPGPNLRFCE